MTSFKEQNLPHYFLETGRWKHSDEHKPILSMLKSSVLMMEGGSDPDSEQSWGRLCHRSPF